MTADQPIAQRIRVSRNGSVRIGGIPPNQCDTRDLVAARDSIDATHPAWSAIVAALADRGYRETLADMDRRALDNWEAEVKADYIAQAIDRPTYLRRLAGIHTLRAEMIGVDRCVCMACREVRGD